jgi:hypothetical protein
MKRLTVLLLAALLSSLLAGCNSDKDKGVNKNKDLPRQPPPTSKEK